MKLGKKLLVLSVFMIGLFACNNDSPSSSNNSSSSDPGDLPSINNPNLVETEENLGFAFHFNDKSVLNGKFKYNLWLWADGMDGGDYQFNEIDDYGVVARYKWTEFNMPEGIEKIGFIVKENKLWEENPTKDIADDRFVDFSVLERNKYGYYDVYLQKGEASIFTDAEGSKLEVIQNFEFAYNKSDGFLLWFKTNNEFQSYKIYKGENVWYSSDTESDELKSKSGTQVVYKIGNELPSILEEYRLEVTFGESNRTLTAIASKRSLYDTDKFNELYTYDGELGAIYTASKTTFRVWSPVSTDVKLFLYDNGTPADLGGSNTHETIDMVQKEKGVWEAEKTGDLSGKYYTFSVTNANYKNVEVVDPYAKSVGLNGLRGMVVNFNDSRAKPEGWDDVQIKQIGPNELTVYETHIADLTSSSTWGGTATNAKLYDGFYEAGTKYETYATGFDHIKELGVNAVQILPIFDHANDERADKRAFNWGYNPLNYNALDGIYSKNPSDGYVRIKEFKNLVKAYNAAGINIIMDVVYNHVNGLDKSNFDVLMPGYYFRYTNGKPSNGSGCGNETASEMPMYRKFMIDSTEFWAKEYKLGGFRFDLMGVHDVETMNELVENLHTEVSQYVNVYGEPWAGGTIALSGTAANQNAMNSYKNFGCFNDKMRDALIKGGLNGVASKGWVTNNTTVSSGDVSDIKSGVIGKVLSTSSTFETYKCVNYVTCHDNYTLYDRIKAAGITDDATIKKMAMLANSVVFTSQGTTFMLAGEEFLRTKGGNENSYNASYKTNELDYSLKKKNIDMFNNYKKLIELKHNKALLGLESSASKNITISGNTDGSLLYYDLSDGTYTYRIVHSNGVSKNAKTVDLSGYELWLDTLNTSNLNLTSSTTINNYQTIIARKAK